MAGLVKVKINDLGIAAYLLMHGFSYSSKIGKDIIFEVEKSAVEEIETRKREYLNSEFHRFDACLMSLKKI